MIRKFAIVPNLLAMMMVLFAMFVPHHHHQTMICLVHQICVLDGCCDDEHTSHSDAHHPFLPFSCVSPDRYSQETLFHGLIPWMNPSSTLHPF